MRTWSSSSRAAAGIVAWPAATSCRTRSSSSRLAGRPSSMSALSAGSESAGRRSWSAPSSPASARGRSGSTRSPARTAIEACAPRGRTTPHCRTPSTTGILTAMATSYTLINLTDVEDSAPKFGFSDHQEARFARGDLEAEDTGVSFHRVKPGRRQGFAHKHDKAEEVYVVLGGAGRVKLDDDIVDLEPLAALRVAPGVIRQFEAGADGLEILAFGPHHDKDGELVKDHW